MQTNSHYYSRVPDSESRPQNVKIHVRGIDRTLTTDSGVFAKKGLDFGTRLLIETVQLKEDGLIVDLGCGYGVVTSVLAEAYPKTRWVLLDVNERAVELSKRNTETFASRREVLQSDGFAAVPNLVADTVLLNPPIRAGKAVVYRLFEESKRHLTPGGALWIVIHKKHGAPSAKTKLEELYERVDLVDRESGYHIFCAQ